MEIFRKKTIASQEFGIHTFLFRPVPQYVQKVERSKPLFEQTLLSGANYFQRYGILIF